MNYAILNIYIYVYIYIYKYIFMYVCMYIYIYYIYTVVPRYYAPRYYADSDITRSVVDPVFLPPGETPKWTCLSPLRIALTILKKH